MGNIREVTQWEIIKVQTAAEYGKNGYEEANRLGNEGWEPIGIMPGVMTLKRPKGVMKIELEETYVRGSGKAKEVSSREDNYDLNR